MDRPAISSDILLEEIKKMIKAHADRHHTWPAISIDTLGLIFRCPLSEIMPLLNDLQEQGELIVILKKEAGIGKVISGSVQLPL